MENKTKKRIGFWAVSIGILVLYLLALKLLHPTKKATFVLQGIGALVQTAVAVLAIWGNQIRALLVGPKLIIELDSPRGQRTFYSGDETPVRYFHLKVSNRRSGAPAINTQVILLSITSPNKYNNQKLLPVCGRLPFPWKFGGGRPYSIIGPVDYCDLGRLPQNGDFELLVERYNVVRDFVLIRGKQEATIEVMAIASNGQSAPEKFRIFWDGEWPENEDEVTTHIKIDHLTKRDKKKDC